MAAIGTLSQKLVCQGSLLFGMLTLHRVQWKPVAVVLTSPSASMMINYKNVAKNQRMPGVQSSTAETSPQPNSGHAAVKSPSSVASAFAKVRPRNRSGRFFCLKYSSAPLSRMVLRGGFNSTTGVTPPLLFTLTLYKYMVSLSSLFF